MKQHSYWKADSLSASQEIIFLVLNIKPFNLVHKSSPQDPILRQMNTANSFIPYFSNINFKILLPTLSKKHGVTPVVKLHEDLCGIEEKFQAF